MDQLKQYVQSESTDIESIRDLLSEDMLKSIIEQIGTVMDKNPPKRDSRSFKESSRLKSKAADLLDYLYFAAVAYLRSAEYQSAFDLLYLLLSLPSTCLAHHQIVGYKKYILLSIILYGHVKEIAKYSSVVVKRGLRPLCAQYFEFSKEISCSNAIERYKKHKQLFTADKNDSLAKRAVHAVFLFELLKIEKLYSSIHLNDLVFHLNLPNDQMESSHLLVRNYIDYFIDEGKLNVTIDEDIVTFHQLNVDLVSKTSLLNELINETASMEQQLVPRKK